MSYVTCLDTFFDLKPQISDVCLLSSKQGNSAEWDFKENIYPIYIHTLVYMADIHVKYKQWSPPQADHTGKKTGFPAGFFDPISIMMKLNKHSSLSAL